MAAVVAVRAQEAVREDAAAQEGRELLLDEERRGTLSGRRARAKELELLTDDNARASAPDRADRVRPAVHRLASIAPRKTTGAQ